MKRLLEYLLLFIVAAVLWGSADNAVSASSVGEAEEMAFNGYVCQTDFSPTDSEFSLPRQVSFANSQRVQSTVRRTNNANRSNVEFAKAGKVVNAGLRYFTQLQSIIIHSSLVEPSRRLLALGKLII